MTNPIELYEEWTEGEENGMRPKRVQVLREELMNATELPVPRSVSEIDSWLGPMKKSGNITRKLKSAADRYEAEAEADSSDDEQADASDEDDNNNQREQQ